MASFVALNVEPEEDSEEEVDNTKEIQIEEGLKLYQNALRLHSQGPEFYNEADAAYDALFESEIFTYPESLSESKRLELYGHPLGDDGDLFSGSLHTQSALPTSSSDGTPSALPQLLYLSYKNHAQFLLDRLMHHISLSSNGPDNQEILAVGLQPETLGTAMDSLELFAEALARDDKDPNLWRRTSRIGGCVGSQRIARFCLEAVIQADGYNPQTASGPHGLEARFAAEDLKDMIILLRDRLSEEQLLGLIRNQRRIPFSLRNVMDTYHSLPKNSRVIDLTVLPPSTTIAISVPVRTWASVGRAILQQNRTELQGSEETGFGTNYVFVLPSYSLPLVGSSTTIEEIANAKPADGSRNPLSPSPLEAVARDQNCYDGDAQTTNVVAPLLHANLVLTDRVDDDILTNSTIVSNTHPTEARLYNSYDQIISPEASGTISVVQISDLPMSTPVTINLPTRKRTLESAGLPEAADSVRIRSKRIRARVETAADEENEAVELARYYQDRLQEYHQADHWLSNVTNGILVKLGIQSYSLLEDVRSTLLSSELEDASAETNTATAMHIAWRDLKSAVLTWDLHKSHVLLQRNTLDDSDSGLHGSHGSSFAKFLEYSNAGTTRVTSQQALATDSDILDFVSAVNSSWTSLEVCSLLWITSLLQPHENSHENQGNTNTVSSSKYLDCAWPDNLKENVVQILVNQDAYIFKTLESQEDELLRRFKTSTSFSSHQCRNEDSSLLELIQSIFELHLDIYGSITNPNSMVDNDTRMLQRDRLERWAGLSSSAMAIHKSVTVEAKLPQSITYRYLWASVVYVHLIEPTSRDHIILCLRDLKLSLKEAGFLNIELKNNAIMPEISARAADREISKLMTMDFFSSIFDPLQQDPLLVIESLEPILLGSRLDDNDVTSTDHPDSDSEGPISPANKNDQPQDHLSRSNLERTPNRPIAPAMQQVHDFLDKATVSLHLILWQKLRTAYESIEYPPMVFLCIMQSVQLVFKELRRPSYCCETPETRVVRLVQWLANLDDLLIRALRLALDKRSAFECMDEKNLRVAIIACVDLTQLLHVFVLQEDSIRVGYCAAPSQPAGPATSAYRTAMNELRDLHVKSWILQYLLLKEAASQDQNHFPTFQEDLVDYLKKLHHALGLRGYCKLAKKLFLKFAKSELLGLQASGDWDSSMSQIIFDLYGLKVCSTNPVLADHGCTPDHLDRGTAFELVTFVMKQAERISVKDLLKTDLKGAIDKMQGVLGAPDLKTLVFNRRILNAYLKSPINPLDMYRSLRGVGAVSSTLIGTEHAVIAEKGWYFLLGFTTFARFRSQKRSSPGPTDDLDIAIVFFRHDLEFDTEKWETWYRLAQVYDAKIEENTTWSADKLNEQMDEIILQQRNAIRCYMMAAAVAVRCANSSFETAAKMSDLYTDFANRVYSSSREPFSMAAFDLHDYKRFCNNHRGTYERLPFRQLHVQEAWKFASELYRQALIDKPNNWLNWYMLGKCLWKISCSSTAPDPYAMFLEVIDAYTKAIRCVPEKKDSRHPDKDPILDPHYKLVSCVHKLVQRKFISPEDGCRYLDVTSYATRVPHVQDPDDWEGYILSVLKSLRAADKANWHHRMVARAAHVIYDDSSTDLMAAHGAKHELTQQIFTKTMSIQVWKPEYERAGRHFVYTRRYVSFFVYLLFQLGDRVSLEALGKRVRKKPGDFLNHSSVWSEVYMTHLKLLRFQGAIPESHEDAVFKMIPLEVFITNADRLEHWAQSQSPVAQSANTIKLVDLIRETVELRRTNANLVKSTLIDDLICDAYARLYEIVVPELVAKSNDDENRDRMRVDHLLMDSNVQHADALLIETPSLGPDECIVKTRPKSVGRREIGRRAEVLIAKAPPPPPPSKIKSSGAGSTPLPSGEKMTAVTAETVIDDRENLGKEVTSSVPGSVHDSADDESELSDIIEEEEAEDQETGTAISDRNTMFPGLTSRSLEDQEGDTTEEDPEDDVEAEEGVEGGIPNVNESREGSPGTSETIRVNVDTGHTKI
ncbi:Histone transcription regulator 3 [Xylographa parallela]|nr:Histone transcription regulator 3 [Xylographa parallela]